jgi:hypothetical protein
MIVANIIQHSTTYHFKALEEDIAAQYIKGG